MREENEKRNMVNDWYHTKLLLTRFQGMYIVFFFPIFKLNRRTINIKHKVMPWPPTTRAPSTRSVFFLISVTDHWISSPPLAFSLLTFSQVFQTRPSRWRRVRPPLPPRPTLPERKTASYFECRA